MPPCRFSAGIDASDFDWARGPMDLNAAVRDGIVFFTHKATEGTRTKHVHYGEALHRARAAGMPCLGAYFVPRTPGNSGNGTIAQQVAYFLAYLDSQTPWWRSTPEFFIEVDTEHWGYDDVAPQYGAQACALLRELTGKVVIHYAPAWAYGDTIPGDDPLWASSYGANSATHYRQAYPGDGSVAWKRYSGRTPTILQYGSRTTIGSQPSCDASAFRGSLDEFRTLITGGTDVSIADERVIPGTGETLPQYLMRLETQIFWGLSSGVKSLQESAAGEKVRDAATATQIAGLTATVSGLTDVIKAGGGNVETAAIGHLIQDATDRVTALVEQRHNEEMAVLERDHAAEVAALRAQLAELTAGDAPAQG